MEHEARERIGTYTTYREAQAAVDTLSDKGFPVQHLSIVAEDLRLVEDITGRRGYSVAAGQSLLAGAIVGALAGYFFGLFSLVDPLISALALASYGVVFGAVVGTLFGLVGHWASRGRREFSSSTHVDAGRYHLMAAPDVAADASRLVDGVRGTAASHASSNSSR